MKEVKLEVKNSTWLSLGLSLLALVVISFTIPGLTPTEQFTKGLLAGLGAGIILVGVYLLVASRAANPGSSQK